MSDSARNTTLLQFVATLIAAITLAFVPSSAWAQSGIAGVVKDTSGGILPGVTVEASSPALIEKIRTVVTDSAGQYRIVDLRPGIYSVTFALPGFTTIKQDGIDLPSDFTLTLNADLRVGSLQETVTVSGASPVVDVQSNARNQVLRQTDLETLPTGRSMQSIGQLVVGVTLSSPDVGGTSSMQQAYMSVHGLTFWQNTTTIDGLRTEQSLADGGNPQYFTQALSQEMVYATSGAGADIGGGGLRLNMVGREGGNQYSGLFFTSYEPGKWVSNNVTSDLLARGLSKPNTLVRGYDVEGGIGGPLKQDKLWFFLNLRRFSVNSTVADTFVCDGCYGKATAPNTGAQGVDEQYIAPSLARVTWQISPRNKFFAFYQWIAKYRTCECSAGFDPSTAAANYLYHSAYVAGAKWTSPVTNRLLLEAGYSTDPLNYDISQTDRSRVQTRGTPGWYQFAQRTDLNLGTTWASSPDRNMALNIFYFQGSVAYVTGSHSFKTGFASDFGNGEYDISYNADLIQRYRLGVPDSVVVQNTPRHYNDLFRRASFYAQDSWTTKRLTINAGLRWESLYGANAEQAVEAGRFVGARYFPEVPDLPNWKNLAPRFGAVYDLFGNAKTALKFTLNKYNQQRTYGFASQYNALAGANSTATLAWTDTLRDDIAQGSPGCVFGTAGCEVNFANFPANFGVRTLSTPDPDLKRPNNIETSVGVQHELLPRVSVSAAWYRSDFLGNTQSINTLLSHADYTPVSVVSPLDGSLITVYNLNKVGQVRNIDTNAPSSRKQYYNAFELNMNGRLPGGVMLFGGAATERNISINCDAPDNPNALLFCDQSQYDLPWRTQLKLSGSYPLPWSDIQLSASIQSTPGAFIPASGGPSTGSVTWSLSPTTRYAANCLGPCTPNALVIPGMTTPTLVVPLTPGSTRALDRVNQLDLSVSKSLKFNSSRRLQLRFDVFNTLNDNAVLAVRGSNFGVASYLQPSRILVGRVFRVGAQLHL